MEQAILWTHVATGFAALFLGPVAMSVRKRRGTHTRVGEWYHWLVLLVCGLAIALVFLDWNRRLLFLPIAIGSYALALLGYVAAKIRWREWLVWHVSGQGGSYIAMVTAFLVANWHTFMRVSGLRVPLMVAWIAPSVIGTAIIIWVAQKVSKPRTPKR